MVNWKSMVDESQQRQRSRKCHVSQDDTAREMFNTVAPDIIQYLNESYGPVVRATVAQQINYVLQNSKYKGASIVAHSLGTVVTYDTLCLGLIPYQIDNLFLLGSPLGLFVSVYSKEDFVRRNIPFCSNLFNIYHPADLIAYRVEPVIKNSSEEQDAE